MRYRRIRRRLKRRRNASAFRDFKRKKQSDPASFNQVAVLSELFGEKEKVTPKLEIGAPDDKYEKEADTVAEQVVENSPVREVKETTGDETQSKFQKAEEEEEAQPSLQRQEDEEEAQPSLQRQEEEEEAQPSLMRQEEEEEAQPSLQRQEEEEAQPSLQRQEEEEEAQPSLQRQEEEEAVQAKKQPSAEAIKAGDSFESALEQSKASGKDLPDPAKEHMESRMAADFSGVRIHADSRAARLCHEIQAQAFAHGPHVYFNSGKFDPETTGGKRLLAHELTHTIQQSASVQRAPEKDAAGKPTGNYTFKVGAGLSSGFLKKARSFTGDGPLTDDEINKLRLHSIAYRGTVSHAERLLMAALCVPASVAIVKTGGRSFNIPFTSITRANRERVRKSGQEKFPDSVAKLLLASFNALVGLDWLTAAAKLAEAQDESAKIMLDQAGGYKKKMARVIAFAKTRGILLSDVLQAMLNGGSDHSDGDKYMAAFAYTVMAGAGHAGASKIASGTVKVDALSRKMFLKHISKSTAAYSSMGVEDMLKGDTLYLTTNLNIRRVTDRSIVVHEFIHAMEDEKAAAPKFVDEIDNEIVAYRFQCKYLMDEALREPAGKKRDRVIKNAAKNMSIVAYQWSFVMEARLDRTKYEALLVQIFQAFNKRYTAADISKALGMSEADLKKKLRDALDALPVYSKTGKDREDGLKGPSFMDHLN